MAISVKCQCGSSFKAQDHLAGKRVKCPKCRGIIQVTAGTPTAHAVAPPSNQGENPLMDLLEDAGVQSAKTGPTCPACSADMANAAVICVNCGYNVMTGTYLDTYVEIEEGAGSIDGSASNAQQLMEKAERSIDDMPETATGQDFGDGADSYVVATGAVAIMAFFVVVGIVVILLMEQFGDVFGLGNLTAFGVMLFAFAARIWITVVAFLEGIEHGIGCLFCDPYTVIFGFWKGMWWQASIMLLSYFISIMLFMFAGGGEAATTMVQSFVAG